MTADDSNSDVTTEWDADHDHAHRQNHNQQRTSSSHHQNRRDRERTRQNEKEAKRLKSRDRDRDRDRTKGGSRKVEQGCDRNGNGNGGHDRNNASTSGGNGNSNINKRDGNGNGNGKKKGRGGLGLGGLGFRRNNSKSNVTTKGGGGGGGYLSYSQDHDHPPPVIALSRSSFSAGSDSTAESALETTEVDRDRGTGSNNRRERHRRDYNGHNGRGSGSKNSRHHRRRPQHYGTKSSRSSPSENPVDDHDHDGYEDDYDDCDMPPSNAVDFAARHESLINALFEDAKHRQMLKHASEAGNANNSPDSPQQSPPNSNNANPRTPPWSSTAKLYQYPNSNASVISKGSQSRHSNASTSAGQSQRSYNTQGSDLLSPSSHQFKKSLSKRRIKTLQMMESRHQHRARRHLRSVNMNNNNYSNKSLNSSFSSTPGRGDHGNGGNANESTSDSSCTSFTTLSNDRSNGEVNVAHSFLHASCQLQKDSGKGIPPGTGKMAHGRDSTMAKLVRKMDQLAEVEEEGSFANAVLTRVSAKDMTLARGELQPQQDLAFVETRSMLAVKMGFASLRYGVLVHWNTTSGLAEMIVLRKMCSDSFMKVKTKNFKASTSTGIGTTASASTATTKSWRKRMRRTSNQFMGSRGVGVGGSGNHLSVISPAKTDGSASMVVRRMIGWAYRNSGYCSLLVSFRPLFCLSKERL